MERLAGAELQEAMNEFFRKGNLETQYSADNKPYEVYTVPLDLTVAKSEHEPKKIGFPFRSVFVMNCSDPSAIVKLKLHGQEIGINAIDLTQKDSFNFGQRVAAGYLYWDAQPGVTMTLMFSVSAEVRSGSQISVNSGGVSINSGSSHTTTVVELVAANTGLLIPQDLTRKQATWTNESGAEAFVGPATVTNSGADKGFRVAPGDTLVWQNTSALYCYPIASSSDEVLLEEF